MGCSSDLRGLLESEFVLADPAVECDMLVNGEREECHCHLPVFGTFSLSEI